MNEEAERRIEERLQTSNNELNLSNLGLKNIPNSIVHFDWVEELYLSRNEIENLELLEGLTNLKILGLSVNKIKSLESIKYLKNLEWLGVAYNKISDLKYLEDLNNLGYLWTTGNNIKDFGPVEHVKKVIK